MSAKIAVDFFSQRANCGGMGQLGGTLANHLLIALELNDDRAEKELQAKVVERGELRRIRPGNRLAAAGDWDEIVLMLAHPRVVALGETGLDRYWDHAPIEMQRDYFDRHLRMSQDRDRTVVIHCRDAQADVLPMLREAVSRGPLRGVLHAFSGDAAMAAECLDLGLYASFAGNATYTNKKFQSLREAAVTIPADRILIETDSPYLTPEPLRRPCKHGARQKRNEPALVAHVAAALAALRGVPLDQFVRQTTANARRLFQLK